VPDSIALDIESLKSLMGYNDKIYQKDDFGATSYKYDYPNFKMATYSENFTIMEIINSFSRNDSLYHAYLGEYYPIWSKIMSGMQAEMIRRDYEIKMMFQAKIYRETYMYNQFVELVDSLEGERFYSQFRSEEHTSELQSRENLVC